MPKQNLRLNGKKIHDLFVEMMIIRSPWKKEVKFVTVIIGDELQ